MARRFVASARTTIYAPIARVWDALVNPSVIRQYMFGTDVVSGFKEGNSITWKGVWKGKPYEDKGTILKIRPNRILSYSHYSHFSGLPDLPENYHTVTIAISGDTKRTAVALSQDNNPTQEARAHSEANWNAMLENLKNLLEARLIE